ncbi:MAG: radical SAM protein [Micromonosporaceae bacterium]|nr:radical SAM protein [Micromonosporaceae bacterium]
MSAVPLPRRLTQLVVKPTVFCYHRCAYCSLRQDYYAGLLAEAKSRAGEAADVRPGTLPVEVGLRVIDEAAALGMTSLQFSGGDPLLYHHLVDLIRAGAGHSGVFVFMNSVGTGVTVEQAAAIVDAGLGAWNFSIDTLDPAVYDQVRGMRGGLARTLGAVDTVRRAARHQPEFCINYMAVITRSNFRGLPALLAHCLDTGVASLYLMPVYGCPEALLSAADIREFRDEIIPTMLQVIGDRRVPQVVMDNARTVLGTFYPPAVSDEQYAQGIYWPDHVAARRACRTPEYYLLVTPDGKVLPCCQVEITGHGAVGTVTEQSLAGIWHGEAQDRFRQQRLPFCVECSAPQHMTLGLVPKMCRQFRD